MANPSIPRTRRGFVVLNPAAGSASADDVRAALGRYFALDLAVDDGFDTACEICHTQPDQSVTELARDAVARGYDLVVAAGGDGTVSAVANGLAGSDTPLGILPLGTANVLAGELGIPTDLDEACRLLAGTHHRVQALDALEVAGQYYFTQLGVGIDSLMIRDTQREAKRRFGRVAYVWTALTRLLGFQPRRFVVAADGQVLRVRASQVLVANSGVLGKAPLRWGPDIRPDDGRLDVCIIRARSVLDYLVLAWHVLRGQHDRSPQVRYLAAERTIAISARHPLPVQADGEIIGQTPVEVKVAPGILRVIVPGGQ